MPAVFAGWAAGQVFLLEVLFGQGFTAFRLWPVLPLVLLAVAFGVLGLVWNEPLITDFAERLLAGLDELDGWSERVKVMQRNWIGRSTGAELDFVLPGIDETLTVFTTRPDTIHGATFMVLAPEHPFVPRLLADNPRRKDIEAWIDRVRARPGVSRGLAYGVPEDEIDRWSPERRKRYATGGASIASNERLRSDL